MNVLKHDIELITRGMNELADIKPPTRGDIVLRSVAFTFVYDKKQTNERHAYMRANMSYTRFVPSKDINKLMAEVLA